MDNVHVLFCCQMMMRSMASREAGEEGEVVLLLLEVSTLCVLLIGKGPPPKSSPPPSPPPRVWVVIVSLAISICPLGAQIQPWNEMESRRGAIKSGSWNQFDFSSCNRQSPRWLLFIHVKLWSGNHQQTARSGSPVPLRLRCTICTQEFICLI